jgi:rubrerythrin
MVSDVLRCPGELRRERMCGVKIRFISEEVAFAELKKMYRKHYLEIRNKYNIYLCPFCHYWHIGGQAP